MGHLQIGSQDASDSTTEAKLLGHGANKAKRWLEQLPLVKYLGIIPKAWKILGKRQMDID